MRPAKRILAAPLYLVAATIVIVEDWLWDDLARLAAAIGRLPILRRIEALIARLPPYAALLLFGAPSLLLVPLKVLALYLISNGHARLGLIAVVAAKVLGTALVARIFALTRPQLLRIRWFAWLHGRIVAFKARLYGAIRASGPYRAVRAWKAAIRAALAAWLGRRRGFLRRRWDAGRRLARRRRAG